MNIIPYIAFLTVFFLPFLIRGLGVLPGPAVLLIELLSGFIFLISLFYGAHHKHLCVSPKYLVLFSVVCLHFMAGAVVNYMDPAVAFSGVRDYLRYTPFFLLPLVFSFLDDQMKGQMKFLVALGLLQFPIVLIQFFILSWHEDLIGGTFVIGSIMSIFMVSAIAVLIAFYFKERISGKTFLILAMLLFIPTMLNESKGTILLLLFGLSVIILGTKLKRSHIIMAASSLVIMISSFTAVYNLFFDSTAGQDSFWSFFSTDPNRGIIFYLYTGDSLVIDPENILDPPSTLPGALRGLESQDYRTRPIDGMILPIRALSEDPTKLLLGLGIGNISSSRLFPGVYSFLTENRLVTGGALARLLWEIGIFGVFLYLLFFYFIFKDARYVSKSDGLPGALGLGWTGVVAIAVLSLPYKNIFTFEVYCMLFWYFSGYIAAKSFELKMQQEANAGIFIGSVPKSLSTSLNSRLPMQNEK